MKKLLASVGRSAAMLLDSRQSLEDLDIVPR